MQTELFYVRVFGAVKLNTICNTKLLSGSDSTWFLITQVAELEEKLALSAADNAQLLAMCDQLVSDLETKSTL
jgi:hypothetical protein